MADLEQSLLSLLTTAESVKFVWDQGLRPTVFVDPINRRHFDFVLNYWLDSSMQSAPTTMVIAEEFDKFDFVQPEETLTWLVEKLKERHVTNQLEDSLKRTAALLGSDEPLKAAQNLYEMAWDLVQDTTPRHSRVDMATDVQQRRERYTRKANGLDVIGGAPLGYTEIDQFTNGLLPGELAAFVGPPKVGKSHGLAHTVVELRRAGWIPYVATLELDVEVFEERIDAHASGVSYTDLQRGQLNQDQVRRLRETQDEMAALGPLYVERPERGQRTARAIVTRARQMGANVLVVDQLSWMESILSHREVKDRVTEMVVDLREIISEADHPLPCFLAVQFNREGRKNPTMENIAQSASIEQTVDIAYGMSQSNEMRVNKTLELAIMGSRRTDINTWLLSWIFDTRTEARVRETVDGRV